MPVPDATRLQGEWILCAIAGAAARFVPVPLVDDLIKDRATYTAVARTWAAHGRPATGPVVERLATDSTSFAASLGRSVRRLPLTLVLYPFRKVLRVVTAARGVSRDLVSVLFLARTVDRLLTAGWFEGEDPEQLQERARVARRAYDEVVGTADLRLLEHALRGVLGRVHGLGRQATRFARQRFGRGAEGRAATQVETGPGQARVDEGARAVADVLARPDVAGAFAALDARFDAALHARTGQALPAAPERP